MARPGSENFPAIFDDVHVGVSINEGTPNHHPFLDGIFPNKNHLFFGIALFMEPPISVFASDIF